MASNIPAIGKWPDPKNDPIIYVGNPIEADLPGHWIPLSVVKKHIEMRVEGHTIYPIFPKSKSRPKIKLTVKFTKEPYKNKHNEHSDTYIDTDQEDSSLIKAITNAVDRLPSVETGTLVEKKVQKQKYNEQKHMEKHNTSRIKAKVVKVATPSLNTRTVAAANAKAHNGRQTRAPAKPQSKGHAKFNVTVQAPHPTLTIAPDPSPTKAPDPLPTIAPNQPTKAPKPPPTESRNPLPTEAPNLPTKTPKPPPTEAPNPTSTKAPTSPPTQAPSGTTTEATKLTTTTPTGDPFY